MADKQTVHVIAEAATNMTNPMTEIEVTNTVRLARVTAAGSGPERRYRMTGGAPTLVAPSSTPTMLPSTMEVIGRGDPL